MKATVISEKVFAAKETKTSDVIDVPIDANRITIRAKRLDWAVSKGEIIKVRADLRLDGKWIETYIGFGAMGGVGMEEGKLVEYSDAGRDLPEGKDRKVRIRLNPLKSIRTSVEVEFS